MRDGLRGFVNSGIGGFKGITTGIKISDSGIDEYIEGYKDCANMVLFETLPSLNPYVALVFTEPVFDTVSMRYSIEVTFDEKFLQRDSLYSGSTDVYDIVSLLESGWHIRPSVRVPSGFWHGHMITAARDHEKIPITKLITEVFNSLYAPAAIATIKQGW